MINAKMAGEAEALLGLARPYTAADVQEAYRQRARAAHPDGGGTADTFAAVDRAKHVALRWLDDPRAQAPAMKATPCHLCEGKGWRKVQRGFTAMRVQCGRCHGSGDADYDLDRTGD